MKSFQEQANAFVRQGNAAKSDGRIEEAIRAYHAAIELVPAYASLRLVVGDMLFDHGEYSGAAEAFLKVVAFDPEHDQAWASLGQCQLLLEAYDDAVQSFSAALNINQENVEANYYGALLDARRGDEKAAAEKLYRALSLRPGWMEQAQAESLLAPIFEASRKLQSLGSEKRWWEIWK